MRELIIIVIVIVIYLMQEALDQCKAPRRLLFQKGIISNQLDL